MFFKIFEIVIKLNKNFFYFHLTAMHQHILIFNRIYKCLGRRLCSSIVDGDLSFRKVLIFSLKPLGQVLFLSFIFVFYLYFFSSSASGFINKMLKLAVTLTLTLFHFATAADAKCEVLIDF